MCCWQTLISCAGLLPHAAELMAVLGGHLAEDLPAAGVFHVAQGAPGWPRRAPRLPPGPGRSAQSPSRRGEYTLPAAVEKTPKNRITP